MFQKTNLRKFSSSKNLALYGNTMYEAYVVIIILLSGTETVALPCSYAGMLKNHKQNLVAEVEFHNREERLKSQSENEGKVATRGQEKEGGGSGGQEAGRELKQEKTSKAKSGEEAKAVSSKGKSEESKLPSSSSRESPSLSSKGRESSAKGATPKEESGGKAEGKRSSGGKEKETKEKGSSEKRDRAEKKGDGKEVSPEARPSPTAAGPPAEPEVSSTAKAAALAAAKGGRSPSVRNGPVGGAASPARAGQRRQHSGENGSPDSTAEKG